MRKRVIKEPKRVISECELIIIIVGELIIILMTTKKKTNRPLQLLILLDSSLKWRVVSGLESPLLTKALSCKE